jgi:ABC-type molybdate transport system substrate-binding protein
MSPRPSNTPAQNLAQSRRHSDSNIAPPIIYPIALTTASKSPAADKFIVFVESAAAPIAFQKQSFTMLGAGR